MISLRKIAFLSLLLIIVSVVSGVMGPVPVLSTWLAPSKLVQGTQARAADSDLLYLVAFSSEEQPYGPLVLYRALDNDLRSAVPVVSIPRSERPQTPLVFPSHDGKNVALLSSRPSSALPCPESGCAANLRPLNREDLQVFSTDGKQSFPLAVAPAADDHLTWAHDGQSLYYHTGMQPDLVALGSQGLGVKGGPASPQPLPDGYDELHKIDLAGHDSLLFHRPQAGSSLRILGLDHAGALLVIVVRSQEPVEIARLVEAGSQGHLDHVLSLPADILPGNITRISADGNAIECERVLNWSPLQTTTLRVALSDGAVAVATPFVTRKPELASFKMIDQSVDEQMAVMTKTAAVRSDLAQAGITNVPAQETLALYNRTTNQVQKTLLHAGGRLVQSFWTPHLEANLLQSVPSPTPQRSLPFAPEQGNITRNASPTQQDIWMLEAHNGILGDGPPPTKMCQRSCPNGRNDPSHVSAAIMHGVGYTESNWHQFNDEGYHIAGATLGSPVKSFDGGWGEFQQTWGMPPQCTRAHNCRNDVSKIQNSQKYNIGVGAQSLVDAWNRTAGVSAATPNDPYKANHWFFAVWAYNGTYGNNPIDVASHVYGHWYPGAPFRSIYQEYVWYYAANHQKKTTGWTDAYLPSLGTQQLPPQRFFQGTNDGFVSCVSCTIPDWTSGSYDQDWVGVGAPNAETKAAFRNTYSSLGGDHDIGLPLDNGGGAGVHRWLKGWTQDFAGGVFMQGAMMRADGQGSPRWIFGGVWDFYLRKGGPSSCFGYPISALTLWQTKGATKLYRQQFQHGAIVWSAPDRHVVQSNC